MKTTGIFRPYEPVEEHLINDAKTIKENTGMDVIFLRDSRGELWHEAQYLFDNNTLKVVFDENGVIIMFSEDATLLNPVNCAVAEVKKSDVPSGLNESQEWMYLDGKGIVPRVYTRDEQIAQAEMRKASLMNEVNNAIALLQDALDLGMSTEDERARLAAWRRYRILLSRVDTAKPEWPQKPE